MKKLGALLCGLLLLTLFGCGAVERNQYIASVNEKLASFTDCANAFSDSLEEIGKTEAAPTEAQIDEAEKRLDALSEVCKEIETIQAPGSYAKEQNALRDAMAQYGIALEKGRALLEFYRQYDAVFRAYPNPDEGSVAMKQKTLEIYGEFAKAMRQATDSFREAEKLLHAAQ